MSENGHGSPDTGDPQADTPTRPFQDAERVAEEWGEKAVRWLARTVERAREEAEDIWAEAQEQRRRL
jgi:cell division septum initiation protein DivIVA